MVGRTHMRSQAGRTGMRAEPLIHFHPARPGVEATEESHINPRSCLLRVSCGRESGVEEQWAECVWGGGMGR